MNHPNGPALSAARPANTILETLEQKLERMHAGIRPLSPEEEARREAARQAQEARERACKVEGLLARAHLPERHRNRASPDRRGPWAEAETKVLARLGTGCSIALVGARGSGKTQLLVEAARYMIEKQLRPARFVTLTELFMHFKAAYKKDSPLTELEVMKEFRKPRLLCIDEATKIADSEWEQRMFFELLNQRYADTSDTLLTANMPAADFKNFIGPSLASRMSETGGIIGCDWPGFR